MSSIQKRAGFLVVLLVVGAGLFFWRSGGPVSSSVIPLAPTSAPESASSEAVNGLVEKAVKSMQGTNSPTEDLKKEVSGMPSESLAALKEEALAPKANGDRRSAALYLLTQAGPMAIPSLTEVASAPLPDLGETKDPHSVGAVQKTFELSLRIRALEAIDKAAEKDPSLEKNLDVILETQKDPTLRLLTRVSQMGLRQGKPGKLQRFIDKALEEVEKGVPEHR